MCTTPPDHSITSAGGDARQASAPPSDASIASAGRIALAVGVVGVALAALGLVLGCTPHFFRAWLVAFNLFTGAAVGPLVILSSSLSTMLASAA